MSKKLWQSKPTNYIKINIKKKKKNLLPTLDIDKKSWWEFWIYEKRKDKQKRVQKISTINSLCIQL